MNKNNSPHLSERNMSEEDLPVAHTRQQRKEHVDKMFRSVYITHCFSLVPGVCSSIKLPMDTYLYQLLEHSHLTTEQTASECKEAAL